MKANYLKVAGGTLVPADEQSFEASQNLKNNEYYEVTIKLNQNYRLHSKIFAFFKFCAQYYYSDSEPESDQVELVRRNLLISAGYCKQVFYNDGVSFEIVPLSLKYASMPPEERSKCYKKLVSAAIRTIWNSQIDHKTENELVRFIG